jgi:hypothetical protein
MATKQGNVLQAKAFPVTFANDNATYHAFNLPPGCMITDVKCGGKTVFGAAATFTVKVADHTTAAASAVTIATIDMVTTAVTMTAGSDSSFVTLGGKHQSVWIVAPDHSAVAGDLAIVVEYM